MSNEDKIEACDAVTEHPCNGIEALISPREKDLGEFSVRRVLPAMAHKRVGPWVFFDHMGPAYFKSGQGVNVRPHPHIGLCTVTYLFEGEILHQDSLGSVQTITPGDINLMVAGSGIVHSERERDEIKHSDHRMHGLQLWLALPTELEEIEPEFHHYKEADIPTVEVDGIQVRVMMGSAYGVSSPVKTFASTLYLECELKQGQTLTLPACEQRAVYVVSGQLNFKGQSVDAYSMALLHDTNVTIEAVKDTRIALIGGEDVGERFIEWNFVSTTKARIEQAKKDWVDGHFPVIESDHEEFIPLPGT